MHFIELSVYFNYHSLQLRYINKGIYRIVVFFLYENERPKGTIKF